MDNVPKYLWSIASKKISYGVGKLVVAIAGGHVAATALAGYGVEIDPVKLEASVSLAAMGLLEWLHDYVKLKTGKNWL